jgi:hypothetical protein
VWYAGTPPVADFKDIKGIADFLGIHLGVRLIRSAFVH